MKLIRQSKLFFKEGNSDKVYEIDLCELSPNEFLVNFRYGKRGSTLKEGTKTPAAVSRENAGTLFDGLENEKRKKGYQTETEVFIALPSLDGIEPKSVKGAVLQRLQDAVEGKNSFKTTWSTSRVLWKAGMLKIDEAIPFIIKLAGKGDEMQTYAALWALIQLRATEAGPVFNAYGFNIRQKPYIRNIAREGLLTIMQGEALEKAGMQLMEQLPPALRDAIAAKDTPVLTTALLQQTQEGNVSGFTDLYLLAKTQPWLLPVLNSILKTWAFKPPYFRQIRAVYKLAQIRKDALLTATLSYRFEKEPAMFKRTGSPDSNRKQYLSVIGQSVRVGAELKSGESKLAFSQFTKTYFQRNAVDFLQQTGRNSDATTYVRLAVATLLQYTEADYSPAGERPLHEYGQYDFRTKRYTFTLLNYPECSESLLLTTILAGNDTSRSRQPNLRFITGKRMVTCSRYYYTPDDALPALSDHSAHTQNSTAAQTPSPAVNPVISAAVNVFKNLFGRKTTDTPQPEEKSAEPPVIIPETNPHPELFPEHWYAMPEAWVQLLMQAQMHIIHRFAYDRLKAHPRFEEISDRFDGKALLQLLNNTFELPNQLGYGVLRRRTAAFRDDPEFVGQVLNGNSPQAREWAQALITSAPALYFDDIRFVLLLLFNTRKENNQWINNLLQTNSFAEERLQAIMGKTITDLLHLSNTPGNNELATTAIERLQLIAGPLMERISHSIIEQLISSPLEANKILAGNILLSKSRNAASTEIPLSLTGLFLQNDLPGVRRNGIQLLSQYPDAFLTANLHFVLELADSSYPDVVAAMLARTGKLITADHQSGNMAIQHLAYTLIRKEKYEGAHAAISDFITTVLQPYHNSGLRPHDLTKLIHAHYRISQLTGYTILKAYGKVADFSLRQIISFGNHELLAVRQWCWRYFEEHPGRIRYEKEHALQLLDAKWDDTRAYAFHFFKTVFTAADWDADTLISITDAIRPDVESFGKELITLYFREEDAMEYLTKLSEHPGVNVQAFVTPYLSLYAADKPAVLQQLDFYFRSVLTRVSKGRVAKDRIYRFLHGEALKNTTAAVYVASVINDMAAQAAIGDKATCISILTDIKKSYPQLELHLMIKNEHHVIRS